MKRLLAFWLLLGCLWLAAAPAQAQRRFYRRGYHRPRAYPRYHGSRYYHAAPYRLYGGRYYYRPRPYYQPYYYRQPGPAVIIRP